MKMSKFLNNSCAILKNKKFSITERDSFERNCDFYELFLKTDENISVDDLCKSLECHGYCPSDLSEEHDCVSDKYAKEKCICCWKDFLNKQLRPFKQLTLYSALYKDKAEFVELVKSDEYREWIYNYFVNGGTYIDSESILYSNNEMDKKMGKYLSIFMMYVSDLIEETDLLNLANHDEYESESYNFKIKDDALSIALNSALSDEKLGLESVKETETVIMDYGGANVAKELGGKRYSALKIYAKAAFRFFRIYVLKLGFLDGSLGFRLSLTGAKFVYWKYSNSDKL